MSTFKHILVPTDFGDCAGHALDVAVNLATAIHADITLVHVCEPLSNPFAYYAQAFYFPVEDVTSAARAALDAATKTLQARFPQATSVFRSGVAVDEILVACAEKHADLIVIGTHSRSGLTRVLLGSVAERTARLARVPVLVAHHY